MSEYGIGKAAIERALGALSECLPDAHSESGHDWHEVIDGPFADVLGVLREVRSSARAAARAAWARGETDDGEDFDDVARGCEMLAWSVWLVLEGRGYPDALALAGRAEELFDHAVVAGAVVSPVALAPSKSWPEDPRGEDRALSDE